MNDARFNIEAVRNINQLKIFSNDGQKTEKIFWAYLPSGFSINTSMNTDSWFGGIFNSIQKSLSGLIHVANILGSDFTGVDIKKYMFYSGTNPLTFNVHSFLILQNNYDTDILKPLQSLMDFYLPHRTVLKSVDEVITKSLKKSEDTWKQNNTAVGQFVTKIFDLLNQGYDAVKDFIGPVHTTTVPPQMDNNAGTKAQVNNTVFFGRHFYFEDCFITKVDLSIPMFLVEGGRPDIIEVNLTIETARMATADMFKFNKKIDTGANDSDWQWI